MRMTTYLVQAFDARHVYLDTDPWGRGHATEIEGAQAMLDFLARWRMGIAHDWHNDNHQQRRVAYWIVSVDGIPREIYVTRWGRHCRVQIVRDLGAACRAPQPAPSTEAYAGEPRLVRVLREPPSTKE